MGAAGSATADLAMGLPFWACCTCSSSSLLSGIRFYLFGVWAPMILPLSPKDTCFFQGVTQQPMF